MPEHPDFNWDEFAAGGDSGGGSVPRDADRFKPCYRHADRTTGITCQRCDRPICGECMRPASVGFHCPECVGAATRESQQRHARARQAHPSVGGAQLFGHRLAGGPMSITVAILACWFVTMVADVVPGNPASRLLAFNASLVGAGQVWRLVTAVLLPGGFLNFLFGGLFLYLVGRDAESVLGRGRMLAILVLSAFGAEAILAWLAPTSSIALSFAMILGLLAALAAIKHRQGEVITGDLVLIGIMVVLNLGMGSVVGAAAQLCAALAGGLAGWIISRGRNQTTWLIVEAVALVAVIGGAIVAF